MDMINMDMKALGLYSARSLSWHETCFETTIVPLTPRQKELYNAAADFFHWFFGQLAQIAKKEKQAEQEKRAMMRLQSQMYGTPAQRDPTSRAVGAVGRRRTLRARTRALGTQNQSSQQKTATARLEQTRAGQGKPRQAMTKNSKEEPKEPRHNRDQARAFSNRQQQSATTKNSQRHSRPELIPDSYASG